MDELLQRDKAPPSGVAAQADFFLGGSQDCVQSGPLVVEEVRVSEVATIPGAPKICLYGWLPDSPVTVEVTTPTGEVHTMTVTPGADSSAQPLLPLPPGSPAGRYLVDAHQGNGHKFARFDAHRADQPTFAVAPLLLNRGTPIDVFLGGLPPGLRTAVHLYSCNPRWSQHAHSYQATHTVTTDAAGEAHLVLRTSRATPDNCYVLQSQDVLRQPSDQRQFIVFVIRTF